jgi:elongation factor Tu
MAGTVKVPQETQTVSSGGPAILEIELASPVAMERGLGFTILENGQTVGMGTVTELL